MTTTTEAPQQEFEWSKRPAHSEVVQIPLEKIHVPIEYQRTDSPREDEALTNSIRREGVQQPIHVIRDGNEYTLVDGGRRLSISYVCRYAKIPAIIEPPAPDGTDPVQYRHRLRFHLSIRQDLTPSQRAEFIVQTMNQFGLSQKDVAKLLGVDAGSVTNYLGIRKYIPEIVKAIDSGEISLFHGRVFDGLSEDGQRRVWKAKRKEIAAMSGHQAHKLIRTAYNPKQHPEYYTNPEKTLEKLQRRAKGRKSRKRIKLTKSEKDVLATDLSVREAELRDLEAEIRDRKRINMLAAPVVHAILRNEAIAATIPESMMEELQAFAQAY